MNFLSTPHHNKYARGFTLGELLVVIAITSVILTVVFIFVDAARKKARVTKAITDMRAIYQAVNNYYVDTGSTPPRDNFWEDRCERSVFVSGNFTVGGTRPAGYADKGYLSEWPRTPWGGPHGTYHWSDLGGVLSISIETIPSDEALTIDSQIDDGNLTTGMIRMSGSRFEAYYDRFEMPSSILPVDQPCNL